MYVEVLVVFAQSCPTLWPHGLLPDRLLGLRILEWVAIPFSRGSSRSRDQTGISCTVGGFFTIWATREAQDLLTTLLISKVSRVKSCFLISNFCLFFFSVLVFLEECQFYQLFQSTIPPLLMSFSAAVFWVTLLSPIFINFLFLLVLNSFVVLGVFRREFRCWFEVFLLFIPKPLVL